MINFDFRRQRLSQLVSREWRRQTRAPTHTTYIVSNHRRHTHTVDYRWYLVRRVDFGPGETLKEPNNLLAVRILVAARALSCVPAWPSRGGALTNTTQNAWHAARLVACGDMNPYMNP